MFLNLCKLLVHACTIIYARQHVRLCGSLQPLIHLGCLFICLHTVDGILHLPEQKPIHIQIILVKHIPFDRAVPIIFHAYISDQKAGQCTILHKRNRNKRAYIILSEIRDHVLMLQKTLTNLRHGKSLLVFFDCMPDSKQDFLRHIPPCIIVQNIWLTFLIINVQCTIQIKMIDKTADRILHHRRDLLIRNVDHFLPRSKEFHLPLIGLEISRQSLLLDQCFDLRLTGILFYILKSRLGAF